MQKAKLKTPERLESSSAGMRVRPDPLAFGKKFPQVRGRVEAHPPGDPGGRDAMIVAHATREGEFPGLGVRQGRQFVIAPVGLNTGSGRTIGRGAPRNA